MRPRPLYQRILDGRDHTETPVERLERLARMSRERGEVPADPFEGLTGFDAVGCDPSSGNAG